MKPALREYHIDESDGEYMGYRDEDEDADDECSDYGEEEEVPIHGYDEDDDKEEKITPMDEEGIWMFSIKIRPYPPTSRNCSRSRSRPHPHDNFKTLPPCSDSYISHPPPNTLIRSISYITTSILRMSQESTISVQSSIFNLDHSSIYRLECGLFCGVD